MQYQAMRRAAGTASCSIILHATCASHLQIAAGAHAQCGAQHSHQRVRLVQRQVDAAATSLVHCQRDVGQLLRTIRRAALHRRGVLAIHCLQAWREPQAARVHVVAGKQG